MVRHHGGLCKFFTAPGLLVLGAAEPHLQNRCKLCVFSPDPAHSHGKFVGVRLLENLTSFEPNQPSNWPTFLTSMRMVLGTPAFGPVTLSLVAGVPKPPKLRSSKGTQKMISSQNPPKTYKNVHNNTLREYRPVGH